MDTNYLDTNCIPQNCTNKVSTCRAIFDYKGQKDDELSFSKNQIITNVNKDSKSIWWRGDCNGKKQGLFPKSYVHVQVEDERQADGQEEVPLNNLEKGFMDVAGCGITLPTQTNLNRKHTFRISSQQKSLELTVATEDEFHDWLFKIKEAAEAVDNKVAMVH